MPQAAGRARWVARIGLTGALAAAGLGVLGLAGWLTPWQRLARGTEAGIPMAPSTAVLLLVLGTGLVASAQDRLRRVVPWAGAAVAVLGALSLLSYLAGGTAWLDRLFVPSLGPFGTQPAGRMSPLTALAFLWAGAATIGVALERERPWAGDLGGVLGALLLALGLLVGLTYVLGAPLRWGPAVPVALPTAAAFGSLGTALVAVRGPVRFPLRMLSGPSHAARLSRTFLPIVPVAVLAQAALYGLMQPVFDDALRAALLALAPFGLALVGVLGAAHAAGRTLDRADAERRRAEASEARLRALFESDAVGILFADVHGNVFEANDALLRLSGYSREEVAAGAVRWTDLTPPEYLPQDARAIAEARQRGACTPYERPFVRKDGTWVWTLAGFTLLAPEREASVAFVVDVTDRKRSEAALRASEARFAALFRGSPLAIAIADLESGRLLDVNERCAAFFGYAVEELVGRSLAELDLWEDPGQRDQLVARLAERKVIDGAECRFRPRRGGTRAGLLSATVLAPEGQQRVVIAMVADVTERQELEARLRQAQSLEAVGRLAGGVAHDFNNLLAVILGHTELLRRSGAKDAARRAGEIANAAERAAALTRQLLAFGRRQVGAPVTLDLNLLLADLEGLVRSLLGEGVQVVRVSSPEPALVRADPGQLQQVVIDLCANAREAMPQGGTLRLETSVLTLAAGAPQAPPGDYVRLVLQDTGAGMDAATRAHLFEPFFSTKHASQGAGLGLPAVYGIVKQSGGHIDVESQVGRGSRFEILLPRAPEGAAPERGPTESCLSRAAAELPASVPALAAAVPRGRGEAVLVVEDDPAMLEVTVDALQELGYAVLAAATPLEALEQAQAGSQAIDLLVSDVIMPGMNGQELAERLRALRPGLPCLFVSGYTADALGHRGQLDAGVLLLQKPFTRLDLARRVRQALAG